jgi:hypothetical protein
MYERDQLFIENRQLHGQPIHFGGDVMTCVITGRV